MNKQTIYDESKDKGVDIKTLLKLYTKTNSNPPTLFGYGKFSLRLNGSVMFGATFNLATRVGLPYFLEQ